MHFKGIYIVVMPTRRQINMRRAHYLYRFIDNDGLCVYCGSIATVKDHFVPISVAAYLAELTRGEFLLPACRNCNAIVSARVFRTVGEKRRWIQSKLLDNYHKLFGDAEWDDEELDELGPGLRRYVEDSLVLRDELRRRIAWRNTESSTNALIAAIRTRRDVRGLSSAPSLADVTIIRRKETSLSLTQRLRKLDEKNTRVNREFYMLVLKQYGEKEAKIIMEMTKEKSSMV